MDDTMKLNKPVQEAWTISELLKEIPRLMNSYLKVTLQAPGSNFLTHSCELLEGR